MRLFISSQELKRLTVTCIVALLGWHAHLMAQREAEVGKGLVYTYYAPSNMTPAQAKRNALAGARNQAIGYEFGTLVASSISVLNAEQGDQTKKVVHSSMANEVKGIWLKDLAKPVWKNISMEDDGTTVYSVEVYGLAREIVNGSIDYEARVLCGGTEKKFEGYTFRGGDADVDPLYLYFKSPVAGFLTVYLLDETAEKVNMLLPYQQSEMKSFPIERDKEYIFFSDNHPTDKNIDEIYLTAANPPEINDLYIVFSPNEFVKPNTDDQHNDGKYLRPRELSYDDFTDWLSKKRIADKDMKVTVFPITIN